MSISTGFRAYAKLGGKTAFRATSIDPFLGIRGFRGQVVTRVPKRLLGSFLISTITGISRDSFGVALGLCTIELYQSKKMVATTTSDDVGNYTFYNPGPGVFRIIADKAGVSGVTADNLTAS